MFKPITCTSADGSITLVLSGGGGITSFNWSTPNGSGLVAGQQNQTGLTAGTYNVTVNSSYGCSATASYVLSGPGNCFCPTIGSVSSAPSPACVDENVTLTASGLINMAGTYGIVFKSFAAATADPYTGGTILATVANALLGGGGTSATATVSFALGGTNFIYAILTPTPADGACRPSATTTLIVDMTAPTISCPANIAVNNTTGLCSAVVTYITPVGTDNCPSPTTVQIGGLASGGSFPVGVTTNIFRVSDGANATTCSFTVTVTDNEAPVISCPANIAVNNTTGLCGAIVSYSTPAGTDNCPGATTVQTAGLASGSSFPVGATTNTFRVTAGNSTTATCSFTVTVTDNQAPAITCPANIAVNNTAGLCSATVTYATPTGTDNCPGATTVQTAGLASGSSFPVGATTNTFRVTAGNSTTATCSFTVTVTDNQAPAITCPANIAVNSTVGLCSATVTYVTPVGTDNCSGASTTQTAGNASGSSFPVGTTTNTFRVTAGNGATSTCAFTVTVTDNQPPVITCPVNQNIPANASCSGQVGVWNAASVSDNCTAAGSIVVTQSPNSGTALNGHNAFSLVTLTANDGNGNTRSCNFTVTLKDVTAPTALCKNITANLGVSGTVLVLPAAVNNGSSDNCAFNLSVTPNTFNCSNIGTNIVTLRSTDAGGNTATCTAMVTVKDMTGPNASCKNPIIFLDNTGHATLTVAQVNNGSTDACGISLMGITKSAFNCTEQGTNAVRLLLTDANGNTSSCLSTVTVKDAIVPTAYCEDVTVQLQSNGYVVVYGANLASESFDNCAIVSYAPTAMVYKNGNIGDNNLTITVKDFAGNAATCVSVVTVEPMSGPQEFQADNTVFGTGANTYPFLIFPNPTTSDISVLFEMPSEQTAQVRIYDLQGRMLLSHSFMAVQGENLMPVSLENFASGVYLVDFQSADLKVITRLVVGR